MSLLTNLLNTLKQTPESVTFADTIAAIEAHYDFTPTAFSNGDLSNEVGQNSGSCKILAFAQLHELTVEQTLACFGDYYRQDVLQHPDATDHQNIRNFMNSGWQGVTFSGEALVTK